MVPFAEPEVSQTLLVLHDAKTWELLDAAGTSQEVGQADPQHILTPIGQTVSPDGRYVLTFDGSDQYTVWDLVVRRPVVTSRAWVSVQISYRTFGFLLYIYNDNLTLIYRYSDSDQQALFRLNTENDLYFDILADGSMLYALRAASLNIGPPGIYRVDAITYSPLLLSGAQPLNAVPLN